MTLSDYFSTKLKIIGSMCFYISYETSATSQGLQKIVCSFSKLKQLSSFIYRMGENHIADQNSLCHNSLFQPLFDSLERMQFSYHIETLDFSNPPHSTSQIINFIFFKPTWSVPWPEHSEDINKVAISAGNINQNYVRKTKSSLPTGTWQWLKEDAWGSLRNQFSAADFLLIS